MPSRDELAPLYSRNEKPHLENGLALELEALLQDDHEAFLHYFADRLGALERFVPDFRARHILDLGCASGPFVQALKHAGAARAEGVDLARALVGLGRTHFLPRDDSPSAVAPPRGYACWWLRRIQVSALALPGQPL
jgi:hypothetical protein